MICSNLGLVRRALVVCLCVLFVFTICVSSYALLPLGLAVGGAIATGAITDAAVSCLIIGTAATGGTAGLRSESDPRLYVHNALEDYASNKGVAAFDVAYQMLYNTWFDEQGRIRFGSVASNLLREILGNLDLSSSASDSGIGSSNGFSVLVIPAGGTYDGLNNTRIVNNGYAPFYCCYGSNSRFYGYSLSDNISVSYRDRYFATYSSLGSVRSISGVSYYTIAIASANSVVSGSFYPDIPRNSSLSSIESLIGTVISPGTSAPVDVSKLGDEGQEIVLDPSGVIGDLVIPGIGEDGATIGVGDYVGCVSGVIAGEDAVTVPVDIAADVPIDVPVPAIPDPVDVSVPVSIPATAEPGEPDPDEPDKPITEDGQADLAMPAPDLSDFFPFCIPFDIYNMLSLLDAQPVAPSFAWTFPNGNGGTEQFEVDLSMFDSVAAVLRQCEKLAFAVSLAFATKRLIQGGG